MKPFKDLFIFLSLEVFSIVWAAAVFSLIHLKVLAAALAGGYFFCFSIIMLIRILRWPKWWRCWTLYPLLIFLFGCTIPMLWVRFTHIHTPFEDLTILGMKGPEFHHVSSSTLGLMILVTLAETVAQMMNGKKKA